MKLEYGHCPKCGEPCQPEYSLDDENEEWVTCCDCQITWELYHDDPTDPRDNTQPWRTYRVGNIQTFDDIGYVPRECDGHSNIAASGHGSGHPG